MLTWNTLSFFVHLFQAYVVAISGLNSRQIRDIVSEHNSYRRLVAHRYNISNMNKITWSDTLRQRAHQLNICSRRSRRMGLSSESQGRSNSNHITSILSTWFGESSHYLQEHQACLPWNSCNRFRRMVNAEQTTVGCSLKTCGRRARRRQVFLCLYEGGSDDSFNFKTGSSCAHCGEVAPFCENSLCIPCNNQDRSCDCRKSCQRDGVGSGSLNSTTCVCTCQYGLGPNCDLECKNPQLYEDYDYCGTLSKSDCNESDLELRAILMEYCPEQCVCQSYPMTSNGTEDDV